MHKKLKDLIIKAGSKTYRIVKIPVKWYWKRFNIRTHGVRVLVIHEQTVLLVRHWYNGLWVMPGGGIKKHETPEEAAFREVREEAGFELPHLDYKLGAYSNNKGGKNDTVHCFVTTVPERFELVKKFNIEISDIRWCAFEDLPKGTSSATRLRIKEHLADESSGDIRPWI